ncbi:MAG TPA: putative DNA modification/repair radical SAM protein [Tissierellia bacterium]|nr:putative DNA modification/repair radical SAM protein [Tissierellia bacterium]
MELLDKIQILADSAKYDVACASSGVTRRAKPDQLGNASACGICHSWSEDGRCISLLKILYTNVCIYDCAYCINRHSNDRPRASFTPQELIELVIGFYKRNYIEGLFLSSGVKHSPDKTMEELLEVVKKLRTEHRFNGYIHLKLIPGASHDFIRQVGRYVDRLSVNLELPTMESLKLLAPDKGEAHILPSIRAISEQLNERRPDFLPAGQSTQVIIGATPDTDHTILQLSQALYRKRKLKRVYYSAYIPVNPDHPHLPARVESPKLREHRLYQSDWLLRFYGFDADELLSEGLPHLNLSLDPKAGWALNHLEVFPVDVMRASYYELLRVPGIGPISAKRITRARAFGRLSYDQLKKAGVVLKRAKYFITSDGQLVRPEGLGLLEKPSQLQKQLLLVEPKLLPAMPVQLDYFDLYPDIFSLAEPGKTDVLAHLRKEQHGLLD